MAQPDPGRHTPSRGTTWIWALVLGVVVLLLVAWWAWPDGDLWLEPGGDLPVEESDAPVDGGAGTPDAPGAGRADTARGSAGDTAGRP